MKLKKAILAWNLKLNLIILSSIIDHFNVNLLIFSSHPFFPQLTSTLSVEDVWGKSTHFYFVCIFHLNAQVRNYQMKKKKKNHNTTVVPLLWEKVMFVINDHKPASRCLLLFYCTLSRHTTNKLAQCTK